MIFQISTPLRIDIGGGVTDIPVLKDVFGTSIFNIGIDVYADEFFQQRMDLIIRADTSYGGLSKLIYNGVDIDLFSKAHDPYEAVRTLIHLFTTGRKEGFYISIINKLPISTGLGASASLFLCLGSVLKKIMGIADDEDPIDLIKHLYDFETKTLGIIGGFQDYIAANYGRCNYIDFSYLDTIPNTSRKTFGMEIPKNIESFLNETMIIATIVQNNLDSGTIVNDELAQFELHQEKITPFLHTIIKSNQALYQLLMIESVSPNEIGEQIRLSWYAQKQLSRYVGAGRLADIEQAVQNLVYGLRCVGAGGNSIFMLAKSENKKEIIKILESFMPEIILLFPQVNKTGLVCTFDDVCLPKIANEPI